MATRVLTRDDFKKADLIGGVQQAFIGKKVISAIVLLDSDMNKVEEQVSVTDSSFPYIPGYRFFREGSAIKDSYSKLKNKPDLMIVEGHGILHPLRIGLASHIGIMLDIPTIGVAKTLLCGEIEPDGKVTFNNEIRGFELRTREYSKPVYISPGHRVSIQASIEMVKKSLRPPHKMPEQIYRAHRLSTRTKQELQKINKQP